MSVVSIDNPGFIDPVGDAQATFRAVLEAIAHPGRICAIGADLNPPAPFDRATAAVALSLVDQETPLFLDAAMQSGRSWLKFHAGAAIADDPADADFLIASSWLDLDTLRAGSHEAPEASATLIMQIAALGTGSAYRLAGPGLAGPASLQAAGLPEDFAAAWQRNHALFPRGIDIVLCAGDRLAALPRSVFVEAT